MNENPRLNAEGYSDPTPYEATRRIEREGRDHARIGRLMKTLFYIIDLAGFRLEGRLTLIDKFSGKKYY